MEITEIGMLDKVDNLIPAHLVSVFSRTDLQEDMAEADAMMSKTLARVADKDDLYKSIHVPTFTAIMSDLRGILKAGEPYAVCDWCDGVGCDHCKGKGWMGKFMFDMTQRKE
jgi:hypothetical protein